MFKRILMAAVLLLTATAIQAQESSTRIVGINGSWWNPVYAGEGFALEQYEDGFVIGYWYTYDSSGNQLWLIGVGQADGNHIELDMARTEGGQMASIINPSLVQEEPWGKVTLAVESCEQIQMSFESLEGDTGGYHLRRLIENQDLAGNTCAEVQDNSEPGGVDIASLVKVERYTATGTWQEVSLPLKGSMVINKAYSSSSGFVTHMTLRLTPLDGSVTVVNVDSADTGGKNIGTAIDGIFENQVVPRGGSVNFRLRSELTGNETTHVNYQVELRDIGEIVNLTIQLTTN